MASKILDVVQPEPPKVHIHPHEVVKDIRAKDLEGLKVVFINMPLRETSRPTATPEGALLMATNLRQNYGVEATVIDLNAYRIKDKFAEKRDLKDGRWLTQKETLELLKRHFEIHGTPDVVSLSGIITTLGASKGQNVAKQTEVAKMVREELAPDAFMVSGNGLATELKIGLFNYIPELDAVAHSEGDDVILKICLDAKNIRQMGMRNALSSGKLAPYYFENFNGRNRFMYAGERPIGLRKGILPDLPFADLSLLETDVFGNPVLSWIMNTPAWSASVGTSSATPWRDEDLVPKANSVSSRGCPFICFFCFRGQQGERNWGVRAPEHLHREVLWLIERYGLKYMVYPDDNFAVAIPRIEEMVSLFKDLPIHWGTHTRMDEAADPRRIKPMADAGCNYIGFGGESAHPDTLEAIGKGDRNGVGGHILSMGFERIKVDGIVYDEIPRSMTMAIRNCLNYGIHPNCSWMMGSPGETLARLKQTVAFIKWQEKLYDLHAIPSGAVNKRMFTTTWYPGTELIKYGKVRAELTRIFGLTFQPTNNPRSPFEPVCDEAFHRYLLELDDATKVLEGPDGEPLNFSEMPTDVFMQAREYIDSGQLFRIMEM